MITSKSFRLTIGVCSLAMGTLLAGTALTPTVAHAAAGEQAERQELNLSVGRGRLINLPSSVVDVFVASHEVADVQIRSSTQLYIFGKKPGETSIYATDSAGRVVYSVVARVGNNVETIDQMLSLAMPESQITVTTMNGFVLLTGTVAAPEDAAEADRLVAAFVGEGTRVISRLQTATPLQVNLQVRIAEVSRSLVRTIGGNILSQDRGSGMLFGAIRGNGGTITTNDNGSTTYTFNGRAGSTTLGAAGRLLGLDVLSTLDLAERSGMVVTLAQPNLTTVSGETADFLAGGEYPIPVPNTQNNSVTIEYKKYGVSLAYTPTVLSNGRISLRVRPEVSELSTEGAITINNISIPALTVRRTETTVELGSGESFMIAGLMSNRSVGAIDSTPGLGDVPILGALFKSDDFRRGESELVIVVTPYLVRPVSLDQIALPTDGFRAPTDAQRILFNGTADGVSGGQRPMPQLATDPQGAATAPATGVSSDSRRSRRDRGDDSRREARNRDDRSDAAPGFSFNN